MLEMCKRRAYCVQCDASFQKAISILRERRCNIAFFFFNLATDKKTTIINGAHRIGLRSSKVSWTGRPQKPQETTWLCGIVVSSV